MKGRECHSILEGKLVLLSLNNNNGIERTSFEIFASSFNQYWETHEKCITKTVQEWTMQGIDWYHIKNWIHYFQIPITNVPILKQLPEFWWN